MQRSCLKTCEIRGRAINGYLMKLKFFPGHSSDPFQTLAKFASADFVIVTIRLGISIYCGAPTNRQVSTSFLLRPIHQRKYAYRARQYR